MLNHGTSGSEDVANIRDAYELALAFLDQTYLIDDRIRRKLGSIILKIYMQRDSTIDVKTLAKAGVERWSNLCGPPVDGGGNRSLVTEASAVGNR